MNHQELWDNLSEEEQEYRRLAGRAERAYVKELKELDWFSLNDEQKELVKKHAKQTKKVRRAKKRLAKVLAWDKKVEEAPAKMAQLFKKVNQSNKLFCMDLEFCENSGALTEVGVATWLQKSKEMKVYHFVVANTYHLRNGQHVPDHKDDFQYGESQVLPLDLVEASVESLLAETDYLVGHAFANDKAFLAQCGYFENTEVLDTQHLAPLHLLKNQRLSLGNVVRATLNEEPAFLHNGGNDAYYTLKSLLKMAEVE